MHVSGKVDVLPVTALEFCSVGGGREVLTAGLPGIRMKTCMQMSP